jgi:DNA polymerase-3 subunit alpha
MLSSGEEDDSMVDAKHGTYYEDVADTNALKEGDFVTCGGIITSTRSHVLKSGLKMGFGTVEDMLGTIDITLFPKVYEKYHELLQEENIVSIKGRISIREGFNPSVSVDHIELMNIESVENKEEPTEQQVEKPKELRLCLIYDVTDKSLHSEVCDLLNQYAGNSDVYVKDINTQAKYKLPQKVEIRKSLEYELQTLLGKDNIIIA